MAVKESFPGRMKAPRMSLGTLCCLFAILVTFVNCEELMRGGAGNVKNQHVKMDTMNKSRGRSSSMKRGSKLMMNDKKKSIADNEVFDSFTTKGQLDLLLSELRQVRTEIREARQEHGRLASGVAEISGQVRVINEKKDQIKKKIRKLTKTLTKKDHHRKVKNGLRSLQQDHEKIFQAMTKAKLLNRISAKRGNRTNFQNGTNSNSNRGRNKNENRQQQEDKTETTSSEDLSNRRENGKARRRKNPNTETENQTTSIEIERTQTPFVMSSEEASENEDEKTTQSKIKSTTPLSTTTTTQQTTTTSPTTTTTKATTTTTTTTTTPKPTNPPLPVSCYEVLQYGNWTSGVYTIQPGDLSEPIQVWCDQRTDGGGWTVMAARRQQEKQEDFSRPWDIYKKGFGEPDKEHWIGLEALHQMTKNQRHELRVNITDWSDNTYQAVWKEFTVAGEDKKYTLNVGRYSSTVSTAGDALKWHNNMKFSTVDRDNDALMGGHCARKNRGGWWYRGYRGCYQAHPTGIFQVNTPQPTNGTATENVSTKVEIRNPDPGPFIYWVNWRGTDLTPKTMFLMIRPILN